jgi:diphthamide biosynthesis protein 2
VLTKVTLITILLTHCRVQRTPVYHVFGTNNDLNRESCLNALDQYAQQTLGKYVVVLYHLSYCDAVKQLKEAFEQRENVIARVTFATVDPKRVIQNVPKSVINHEQESSEIVHDIGSLQFRLPQDETDYKFFYIGEDSPSLTHIMMDNNSKQFARFSIILNRFDDGSSESSKISRMLKRRYYLVHLGREANVIGILVATTSAGNYLQMIERVKRLITDAGKKYYVFFVGKLNVPKLANFAEIDLYVLISCPQNSLIDSKEFLKPIVTPFELQMGLLRKDREWTGEYITDFNKLLLSSGNDSEQEPLNDDEYDYSFITGTMKKFSRPNRALSENEQAVDQNALVSVDSSNRQLLLSEMTPAMNFLQTRTYRGLEQTEEETPVGVMVEGRSGIARGYTHESEVLNQK